MIPEEVTASSNNQPDSAAKLTPTQRRRERRRRKKAAEASARTLTEQSAPRITAEPFANEASVTAPAEVPQVSEEQAETEATAPRPRRRRRQKPASAAASAEPSADEVTAPAEVPQDAGEQPEAAPSRPRRRRRRSPVSAATTAEPSADEVTAPAEVPQVSEEQPETEAASPQPRRRRQQKPASAATTADPPADEVTSPAEGRESRYEELAEMAELPSPRKRRAEAAELASPEAAEATSTRGPFAHPAEEEFSHLLNFYGVKWLYEPRSFPLRWDGNRTVEMFTPDFYLPEEDLFVELTTLKQSLVTEKNRKLRHLRELYPDINIKLLYRRDIHRLLAKYGYGPLADEEIQGIERVLITKPQIERRVAELGRQISADYEGEQPVLVGVLRGVACFMSDLMRQITLPLSIDFMAISTFDGSGDSGVRITKDLDINLQGRHVLMVEDIVDTGMTLNYLLHDLTSRGTASLKVCTLLDKQIRRLADFKLDYVGFEVPDEFLVGYGLDYLEKYRNLPFIGILKPGEQPATPSGRGRRRPRKSASEA